MHRALRVAMAGALFVCAASRPVEGRPSAAAPTSGPPAAFGAATQRAAAASLAAASLATPAQPPAAAPPPASAQQAASAQGPPGSKQASPGAVAPAADRGRSPDTGDVPVVSIERIRALLASGSIFGVERLSPDDLRPVFRSRVEERAFKLPDFVSTLDTGFAAVPPGGLTQYEINRLITPDMYRGMAVFTNQEVLRVMALALRNALLLRGLGWAVDKGRDAWDNRQVERIRDEIRSEIAAIEEENRRRVSGIKPPAPESAPVPAPVSAALPAPSSAAQTPDPCPVPAPPA